MSNGGDGTTNRGHMAPLHVWVAPDGRWHDKRPGVAWDRRRGEDGWEYFVAYATGGGNVAPGLRQGWVSAALIRRPDEMKS